MEHGGKTGRKRTGSGSAAEIGRVTPTHGKRGCIVGRGKKVQIGRHIGTGRYLVRLGGAGLGDGVGVALSMGCLVRGTGR